MISNKIKVLSKLTMAFCAMVSYSENKADINQAKVAIPVNAKLPSEPAKAIEVAIPVNAKLPSEPAKAIEVAKPAETAKAAEVAKPAEVVPFKVEGYTPLPDAQKLPLQEEAIAQSRATVKDPISRELIEQKVRELAQRLVKEGIGILNSLRGKTTVFSGNYIWVHTLPKTQDGETYIIMHPVMAVLEMKPLSKLKDTRGKYFFREFNTVAWTKGEGWVSYYWLNPACDTPTIPVEKISFVKKVSIGNQDFVVGCGTYDKKVIEAVNKANVAK